MPVEGIDIKKGRMRCRDERRRHVKGLAHGFWVRVCSCSVVEVGRERVMASEAWVSRGWLILVSISLALVVVELFKGAGTGRTKRLTYCNL